MGNFMEYLELTPSTINQFFNTITREGQDQIFFEDVVQVIGYLEESKLESSEKDTSAEGLNLNLIEIELILNNFENLRPVKTLRKFEEEINGIVLMFVVDFEKMHGSGSAPEIFNENGIKMLFKMMREFPMELKEKLEKKMEDKMQEEEVQGIHGGGIGFEANQGKGILIWIGRVLG
jgi:hypothetical protein